MNKQGLVEAMARETKLTRADMERAVEAFMQIIQDRVAQGEDVTLMGFGTFHLLKRKARRGHDPHREKAIEIPAMNLPKFRAGKDFRDRVRKK